MIVVTKTFVDKFTIDLGSNVLVPAIVLKVTELIEPVSTVH